MLLTAGALALAWLPGLARLENDNSPRIFFIDGSQAVADYDQFLETFGTDEAVRVSVRGDGLWSKAGLQWIERLETQIAEVDGVLGVVGPFGRRPGALPEDLKSQMLASELDRQLGLISPGGTRLTLVARLITDDDPRQRWATEALDRLLDMAPHDLETSLVGLPVLNRALDASSREVEERFFPALVAFAVLLLCFIFRDFEGLLMPLGFVGFVLLAVMATMGYWGSKLNLVLSVLPPLLFVITLATALHILLRFRVLLENQPDASAVDAVREVYAEKGWAVWWAGFTTMVGFASLAFSPVAPVRSLGRWAALGLGLMTILAFVLFPVLLASHRRRPKARPNGLENWSRRWGRYLAPRICVHRRSILLLAIAMGLVAAAGLPRLEVESNALHYLDPEHPVRHDIETLQAEGIGSATVEVVLSQGHPLDLDSALPALAQIGGTLAQEPLILGAVSGGTLFNEALAQVQSLQATPLFRLTPEAQRQLALDGLRQDPAGRQVLDLLVDEASNSLRLTLFIPTIDHHQLARVLQRTREVCAQALPGFEVITTGQYPLLLEAQSHLLTTLGLSLCITFLVVGLVFFWLLPGRRLAFLALLPNLWPVLGVLGIMGWSGVPVDIATVMVASVALGLAVDDTLHTLGHFRIYRLQSGVRQAVSQTVELTTPAYLLTGLILMVGFGVCGLSDFAPTSRFGGLSALAIGLAVLGDLFLLPALLSLSPETGPESTAEKTPSKDLPV